jgi:hypothetical protein
MKKTIIAISMLTLSVSAMAQVAQEETGAGAAGSFSKPTMSLSNLPWATEQAMNEIAFDPTVSVTAPTLTTMIASYRDSELNKIIKAAQDDAIFFVGGGAKRANLAAAINITRELTGTSKSEMALAQEIVAVTTAIK